MFEVWMSKNRTCCVSFRCGRLVVITAFNSTCDQISRYWTVVTYSTSLLWQHHHHPPTWISFATFHSHLDMFKSVGLWDSRQARWVVLVHARSRYQSLTTPVMCIRNGYVRDLLVKTSRTSMMYRRTCLSRGITMRSTSSLCHVIRGQQMTAKSRTLTDWCKYFTGKCWISV